MHLPKCRRLLWFSNITLAAVFFLTFLVQPPQIVNSASFFHSILVHKIMDLGSFKIYQTYNTSTSSIASNRGKECLFSIEIKRFA